MITSMTLSLLAEDNDRHLTTERKIKEEHTIEELLDSLDLVSLCRVLRLFHQQKVPDGSHRHCVMTTVIRCESGSTELV